MLLILCTVIGTVIGAPIVTFGQEDRSSHRSDVTSDAARLGAVDFPTSCNACAQSIFARATALLHSFGYEEARGAFIAAAKADPACGMAHWGVSRTWYHPIWAPPTADELKLGAAALGQAVKVGAKTERERAYIDSLGVFYREWETVDHAMRAKAYEQALARLSERFPGDDEAAIFHALQLVAVGYLDPTEKSYQWQKRGAGILNRVLPRRPNHPGVAHYIIHSVDYPSTAELGLQAARAYARIAPDSAHALHMPSHIFTRLGLWDDSIASNIASASAAVEQVQRLHGGGGSFDQLHAMDYLMYAYLQQGNDKSAEHLVSQLAGVSKLDEISSPPPMRLRPSRHVGLWSGTNGRPPRPLRLARRGSLGMGF